MILSVPLMPGGREAARRRTEPLTGAAAGLAIAALDLGIIGRRVGAIRALEQLPQWLDHVAYGLAVGAVLRARRRGRIDRGTALAAEAADQGPVP